jgi:N-acetylmuramoyl-L-alanine amidase
MSDDARQTPRSRRRLLTLGLATPLLLPLRAVEASAPIRVSHPSKRPGSAQGSTGVRTAAASTGGRSVSSGRTAASGGSKTAAPHGKTTSSAARSTSSSSKSALSGKKPASSSGKSASSGSTSHAAQTPLQRTALNSTTPSGVSGRTDTRHGIAAVRMWPSREYTRVTFELTQAIPFRARLIDNPNRVILDLEGLQVESKVRELLSRISTQDPFVRQVRIGQFNPETLRIVFDLKQPVAPQVFTLKPTGNYQHRLVLDFYPKHADDTLDQLIASAAEAQKEGSAQGKGGAPGRSAPEARQHADARGGQRRNGQKGGSPSSAPATGGRQPAQEEVARIFTVALDPGHGGEDPGATGPKGTHEKDVVLAVAHRVRKLLAKEENLRVIMTRDDDYYVPLVKRVNKARGVRADLFVSIHADAFVKPDASGSSVFVLSSHGATSVGAKWLARNENKADLIGGVNIRTTSMPETASLLMDLYTTAQIRDSKVLAGRMLNELGQIGKLHRGQVEQANFAVLRSPDVPSVLVETAFISNPDEERRLRDPAYQDRLARAIARGILDYRRHNPPAARGKVS